MEIDWIMRYQKYQAILWLFYHPIETMSFRKDMWIAKVKRAGYLDDE
jgi:hypothetical protein